MKSYDEIYNSVIRRRDEQIAKKRRRIAVAGSVVLPAIMLTAAAGVGFAAWQSGVMSEYPAAAESQYENFDIEVVDGRAVVSRCSLGGYTAELELTDIIQVPTAESNYYYTNSIAVRVTDPEGKVAETVLNYNTDGKSRLWQQLLVMLPADHIKESLKLYQLDDNGTKHYVLALRKYFEYDYITHEVPYYYNTLFFSCEDYSFDSGVLNPYTWFLDVNDKSGFDDYNGSYIADTTDDMRISGMTIINDGAVDVGNWAADVYEFNPASCSFTYGHAPQLGGDAIVSFEEGIGYTAYLRLKGLTHVPSFGENYYSAKEAVVVVYDVYGNKAYCTINEMQGKEHFTGDNIRWATDNGLQVNGGVHFLGMEYGGGKHYILALSKDDGTYADVDGSNPRPVYSTMFFDCGDEFGRLAGGQLRAFDAHDHDGEIAVLNTSHPEKIQLMYGTTFSDSAYDMQITFDPAGRTYWFGNDDVFPVWDSLGGYTAYLELRYEDGSTEYSDAVISAVRSDGKWASVSLLNELSGNVFIPDIINKAVYGKHPETAVKLFEMDYKGEKHYVLALRGYTDMTVDEIPVPTDPDYGTVFFAVEPECFESGKLKLYKSHNLQNYVVSTTDSFRLDHDNVFVDIENDSTIHSVVEFDPDSLTFTYELTKEPVAGGNVEVANAHMGGYHAFMQMNNVTHLPTADEDYYSAEDTVITVFSPEGHTASLSLKDCGGTVYEEFIKSVNASHAGDCATLLKLNDNGTDHYVIMLRNYHDENPLPDYNTVFFEFDTENLALIPYEANKPNKLIPTTPTVGLESRNGADVLVTEKVDKDDISYVNEWDYVTACCNKVFGFDHENHTVFYIPDELGIIE